MNVTFGSIFNPTEYFYIPIQCWLKRVETKVIRQTIFALVRQNFCDRHVKWFYIFNNRNKNFIVRKCIKIQILLYSNKNRYELSKILSRLDRYIYFF